LGIHRLRLFGRLGVGVQQFHCDWDFPIGIGINTSTFELGAKVYWDLQFWKAGNRGFAIGIGIFLLGLG